MLHVAIEKVVQRELNARSEEARGETLETVTALVKAGAITALPPLYDKVLSTGAIRDAIADPSHAIGYALQLARKEIDSEMVKFK